MAHFLTKDSTVLSNRHIREIIYFHRILLIYYIFYYNKVKHRYIE